MRAIKKSRLQPTTLALIVMGLFGVVALSLMFVSRAATGSISLEAENGTLAGNAVRVTDTTASGGAAIRFSAGTVTPPPPAPLPPPPPPTTGGGTSTTANFKVAVLGDQGTSTNAKAVLELIKRENVAWVIHLGDFTYSESPTSWQTLTAGVLGATFPHTGVIGNHDSGVIPGMQAELIKHTAPATCTGTRALKAVCKMNGLVVIEQGIGSVGSANNSTDVAHIQTSLSANASSLWKLCTWHEQMATLQTGGKDDSTGYTPFEECRKAGAIILTGHEHSYERTKTLTNFATQTVDSTCATPQLVCVGPNRSFTAVVGTAGVALRDQKRCLPTTYPYGCKGEWAKIYTTSQGGKNGALFITFNVDGNPKLARGVFKDIAGVAVDTFDIRRD